MALFPAFSVPEGIEQAIQEDNNTRFRPSVNFNFVSGDFTRDGQGGLATSGFIKAYNDWIVKALCTERGTSDFYPDSYGADFEEIFLMSDHKQQEMALEKTITETIFADTYKRASYINGFQFTWETDSVEVRFNVYTDEGEIPIIYNLERR